LTSNTGSRLSIGNCTRCPGTGLPASRYFFENPIALQLPLTDERGNSEGGIQQIDPKSVIAHAWNPDRLADAQQRLKNGLARSPDIREPVQFEQLPTYYIVGDGMHQTVSARLAGHPLIIARVDEKKYGNPQCEQSDSNWQSRQGRGNQVHSLRIRRHAVLRGDSAPVERPGFRRLERRD
jgi:hypothetical protein